MIVADSGAIIVFARIGRLDLLRQVVGELSIPDAVYEELVGRGTERPRAL
jgi:predicted nucleic acid-binding protein